MREPIASSCAHRAASSAALNVAMPTWKASPAFSPAAVRVCASPQEAPAAASARWKEAKRVACRSE